MTIFKTSCENFSSLTFPEVKSISNLSHHWEFHNENFLGPASFRYGTFVHSHPTLTLFHIRLKYFVAYSKKEVSVSKV